MIDFYRGLGFVQRCDSGVVIRTRNQLVREQLGVAGGLDLLQLQIGFAAGQLGSSLFHLCLVRAGVNLCDQLPVGHRGIVIHEQFADLTGNLAAHGNIRDRIQCAGGRDHLGDVSPYDRHGFVLRRIITRMPQIPDASTNPHDDNGHDETPFPPAITMIFCHKSNFLAPTFTE